MIDIQHLSFCYSKKKTVFNDFNLRLHENCIYGLLGKNGTGKSTLLYLISGLLRPDEGEVECNVGNGDSYRSIDRRPELLEQLYMVPEEFEFPLATLDQYVKMNAPFYPNFSREVLDQCLHEFELAGDAKLFALSMGQKKKVLLAFAFATNTRVLIMDEPTNGLDIPSKSQFRKLVTTGMTDDKMMLISTHQVRDISEILDHVTILDQSNVLLNASIADVMSRLAFRPMREGDQPLFTQPSVMGSLVVVPSQPDEETAVDLEMLFNATLQNPDAINQMFNASE